jgi:tRNA(His) 5'-end guanylyltransferase
LKKRKKKMNPAELELKMRSLEYFSSQRMLTDVWAIIRVDGRGFGRLTEGRFDKPFDLRFRDLMVETAQTLMEELQGAYGYTMSDEISILLPRNWTLFDRRVEKVVSISAGMASAAFTQAAGTPAHFDGRIWLAADTSLVTDYFSWRQGEAAQNALHSWCYWTLRRSGLGVREASQRLEKKSWAFQNELLFQKGINFNELPLWQRRGVGFYWDTIEKAGYDPKENRSTVTTRRRLRVDSDLPMKAEYKRFIENILNELEN